MRREFIHIKQPGTITDFLDPGVDWAPAVVASGRCLGMRMKLVVWVVNLA